MGYHGACQQWGNTAIHVHIRGDLLLSFRCEVQEGFSKLIDVGILIDPNGRYTWQIVCYSAPRTAVSCSRSHKGSPLRLAWESS